MERRFDSQIDALKALILSMGGHVEKALDEVIQGLVNKNSGRFVQVHALEEKINQEHKQVDKECLSFLAKQGPVAKDLRLIVSLIKINADLERMGDQCVNIAYTGKDFLSRSVSLNLHDLELMSQLVRKMVKDSLDCFVREDVKMAQSILLLDDEVDALKQKIFDETSLHIKKNPNEVEACLDLILMGRSLERMGDHATNIAKDVIFVSTGKDIRHGGDATDTGSRR